MELGGGGSEVEGLAESRCHPYNEDVIYGTPGTRFFILWDT